MKKVLTLFAILFAMVGTMKVQAETRTVTMTVPDKYNGWYAAIYYEPSSMWCCPDEVEAVIGGFGYLRLYYEDQNYIYQYECGNVEESYPLNMFTAPEEPCWFPNDWDWRNSDKYHTPFCGQIVNNTFSYVADMDYQNRYVGYFLVSDMKIDAGVEWVKLYARYQDDHTFTDADVVDSNIFGKMELEAHQDPQNHSDYYTTFYSATPWDSFDFIVVTPDVEVFTINVDGDLANLVPFTEDIIPATLPVLLHSKTEKIIIARTDWGVAPYEGTNHLASQTAYVKNTSYTLAAEDGILGFYQCTLDNIPSDKACLNLPAGVSAPHRIAFSTNTATGMENADATDAAIKAEKVLRNGQLLIKKNGLLYNAQGAVVE